MLNGTVLILKRSKFEGEGAVSLFCPLIPPVLLLQLRKTVNCKVGLWDDLIKKKSLQLVFFLVLQFLQFPVYPLSGARTVDAQWSLFHQNPKLLGLGRQFGLINFSINQILFLQKNSLISKYQISIGIGIWIWIWAAKH